MTITTTKEIIQRIIFQAESVAHLKGFENEILPATDLIKEMVELLETDGKLTQLVFKEFD
jgi:hypothetical protein